MTPVRSSLTRLDRTEIFQAIEGDPLQPAVTKALEAFSNGLLNLRDVKDGSIRTPEKPQELAPLIWSGFELIYNETAKCFFLTRGLRGGTLEEIAKRLIELGWIGNEDELEMAGNKSAPLCKFKDCFFSEKNLRLICEMVLEHHRSVRKQMKLFQPV